MNLVIQKIHVSCTFDLLNNEILSFFILLCFTPTAFLTAQPTAFLTAQPTAFLTAQPTAFLNVVSIRFPPDAVS